jgi:hypothetical protein
MEPRTIPDGLAVFQDRDGAIVIRRRWAKANGASALFAAAVSTWPLIIMTHPGRSRGEGLWPLVLEYLPHASAFIGGGYFALCSLFNRTDVIITADRFRSVSTPLPWWGDRHLSIQEIQGLAVRKRKKRSDDGADYCLMYTDRYGKERELLSTGKGREQVDFIGQAVADIMGIEIQLPDPKTFEPLSPWMERVNKWATSGDSPVESRGPESGAAGESQKQV